MKNLSLLDYFVRCYKNYAKFTGRARRREYWGFILFYSIIYCAVYCPFFFYTDVELTVDGGDTALLLVSAVASILFWAISFVPYLAVTVRRFHDVGKSGWYVFIVLIPVIGSIWFLVEMCTDSEPFENDYGENPK